MNRRAFVTGLGTMFAAPLAAETQQVRRAARIGIVLVSSATDRDGMRLSRVFENSLRELGWVAGDNIVIEYRSVGGIGEQLRNVVAELVGMKVDVIVAWAPPPAEAAKQATKTIPVVFLGVGAPVERGLVTSLNRPGGNVTGVAFWTVTTIVPKMLELAKEIVPRLSRVAVLRPTEHGSVDPALQEAAARSLGLQIIPVPFVTAADAADAFPAIMRSRAQALVISGGSLPWHEREMIIRSSADARLPVIYGWREAVVAGGLMSLGTNLEGVAVRGAAYVDKILRGGKPSELPVEQPTKFELVINLKTAKALGLTIPQSLLLRADQRIE